MKQVVLALAFVCGLASVAAADQGPPGPQQHRGQRGEMRQRLVEKFDRDDDGRLSGREKRAARKFIMRKKFERRMMALRRFDADRDGWLSPEEQRAARQAFRARRQQARGASPHGGS